MYSNSMYETIKKFQDVETKWSDQSGRLITKDTFPLNLKTSNV